MQKISKTLQKGFTIIELIVVIAVLGVLVLLALPKFLDYTEKAKVAQVKNDIVAYEKVIDTKRIDNDKYIKDWEKVDVPTMESLKKSLFNKKGLISDSKKSLFNKKGLISDSNEVSFGGEYYKIPKDSKLVKTNLKGDFYLGQGGEVYYYDENLASKISKDENSSSNNGGNDGNSDGNGNNDGNSDGNGTGGGNGNDGENGQPPVTEPDTPAVEKFKVTFKDYYGQTIEEKTVEKGKSVDPPLVNIKGYVFSGWDKDLTNITSDITTKALFSNGPTDKDLGYSDSDFKWVPSNDSNNVKNGQKGFFEYRGKGRSTVEIPHVIQGVQVTDYHSMFSNSLAEVTKVISTNKNVTDMSSMFIHSRATSLDVSELDTSNVTNMGTMFDSSKALTLDLSTFDTSNVMDMSHMFENSQATSITFGPKFNTSEVKNMTWMFKDSKVSTLDLSKFDTSNVTDMSGMFRDSQATSITFGPKFKTSRVADMSAMFYGSQATSLDLSSFSISYVRYTWCMFQNSLVTTGYAGTQADADKLNASSYKPPGLKFVVKKP